MCINISYCCGLMHESMHIYRATLYTVCHAKTLARNNAACIYCIHTYISKMYNTQRVEVYTTYAVTDVGVCINTSWLCCTLFTLPLSFSPSHTLTFPPSHLLPSHCHTLSLHTVTPSPFTLSHPPLHTVTPSPFTLSHPPPSHCHTLPLHTVTPSPFTRSHCHTLSLHTVTPSPFTLSLPHPSHPHSAPSTVWLVATPASLKVSLPSPQWTSDQTSTTLTPHQTHTLTPHQVHTLTPHQTHTLTPHQAHTLTITYPPPRKEEGTTLPRLDIC